MLGLIITLVVFLDGVVVITSSQSCSSAYELAGSCSDAVDIRYPFWFNGAGSFYLNSSDDYHCGYPGFGLKCVENETTTVMNISNQLYRASNLDYELKKLSLKDMDTDGQECPHPRGNFSLQEFGSSLSTRDSSYNWTVFYNCSSPPPRYDKVLEKSVSCLDNSGRRSYAFFTNIYYTISIPKGFNWYGNCEETLLVPTDDGYVGTANYTIKAKKGFVLEWSAPNDDCRNCERSGGLCSFYNNNGFRKCSCGMNYFEEFDKTCPKGLSNRVKVFIGVSTGVGVLLLVVVLIYRRTLFSKYRAFTSNIKSPRNVEMFLESCGHLTVQRYAYYDIKKMTNSFKETLGQGGYGRVFKGKLKRDGRLVAVKLLNEIKGNGEDFINEVATIGRTNHVNVVSLLGFCTEGTKRALVYEFMPNGSLERFIYNEKTSSTPLGWEKLYQIALGIAKGLEYLHCGCNTRILHFDIKPHNILLDQEFCPKISDFGLAKLCPTRETVVSMLVARGTIGYIAPEVYCRNFGGVSHKSDVYSYGMMVLEIIGGRKNIDPKVENISEIYFPQWIYNRLKQDINIEGSGEIFENETTKKMTIVALWCVQTQPADRPSISKVVEMLEGGSEELQMPPNPFQDFPSSSSS